MLHLTQLFSFRFDFHFYYSVDSSNMLYQIIVEAGCITAKFAAYILRRRHVHSAYVVYDITSCASFIVALQALHVMSGIALVFPMIDY